MLQQYLSGLNNANLNDAQNDFTSMEQSALRNAPGSGVAEALPSGRTPPFPQMVGPMGGSADAVQRASALNQLIVGLNPKLLTGLSGSIAALFGGCGTPDITPEQTEQLHPEEA